jgi:2-keto-4-pentenoate hydratase
VISVAEERTSLWKVALLAFAAMAAQDILATVMVIMESRLNAPVAGLFDVMGYVAALICSVLALDSILKNGWRNRRSLTIIAAVSVANFAGTFAGVAIGAALTHH